MIQEAIDTICEKEPLWSSLVTRLKPVEDKENCPTLGTDGEHLYYNPDFLKKLTKEETCAVVLHEVLHCAFQHQWRKEDRDDLGWNIATDFAINTVVNESFALPKGSLLDMKFYGMSAEEIYDQFPKKGAKGKGNKSKSQGGSEGGKQQGWCEKDSWDDKQKGKSKSGGGLLDKFKKKKPRGTMSPAEKEAMWKDAFDETFLKNFGKLPDSLKRVIEKSYYVPVIDWSSLVASLLSEDTNDYTFAQPDRRFMDAEYVLPGLHSIDRLKDVVFAYDTSGSISNEDLHSYYEETLNLFSNFSSLQGWIAVCDAYLHSFKEISPQQDFEDFNFMGGGGTDFNPVFDKIKSKDMKPKALFYFTDTEGYFPSEEPEYPVFWLVRSQIGENYPLNVPFGTVIRFLG